MPGVLVRVAGMGTVAVPGWLVRGAGALGVVMPVVAGRAPLEDCVGRPWGGLGGSAVAPLLLVRGPDAWLGKSWGAPGRGATWLLLGPVLEPKLMLGFGKEERRSEELCDGAGGQALV